MKTGLGFTAFAAALAVVPAHAGAGPSGPPEAGTFEIHAIDVGTGLAIFVEGHDFSLLYDAGSSDDLPGVDKNRVLAYLRAIRPDLRVIDHVILSHPHIDHMNLLPDIFAAYEVRNVWNSGAFNATCSYRAFLQSAVAEPNVAYHDALGKPGPFEETFRPMKCGGEALPEATLSVPRSTPISRRPVLLGAEARMTILRADASRAPRELGEASVVVRLQLGSSSLLLPGDAEAGGRAPPASRAAPFSSEGKLLTCCAAQLRSDILVAGHHGSSTSSRTAFLDTIDARHYIVSSGPRTFAGLTNPDIDVVMELRRRGTVWRTDIYDAGCAANPAKIGPDNDGKAGGCDNVRIVIDRAGRISGSYNRTAD